MFQKVTNEGIECDQFGKITSYDCMCLMGKSCEGCVLFNILDTEPEQEQKEKLDN